MKNFSIAFIISITIHFILLIGFKDSQIKASAPSTSEISTPKYTQVKLVQLKKPIVKKKEIIKKKKIKKPILKKKYKKVIKKDIKVAKRKKSVFKKKIKENKEYQEQKEIQQLDPLTQQYIKLYGKEYFSFTKETKKYLKSNLNKIGKITQQYLYYPSIAIKTRQEGTNIISFIFKPNGDIEDLKIISTSNYDTLDRNTIKTIKLAYKDYPKPKSDTPIKIFVNYCLY